MPTLLRMLKQILFVFSVLFLFLAKAENVEIQGNSNGSLLKNFKANCQTTENCLYSITLSTSGSSYSLVLTIVVDSNIVSVQTLSVKSSEPATAYFQVSTDSIISISFDQVSSASSSMLFTLKDNAGNTIIDSKSRQFIVPNECRSSECSLTYSRTGVWKENVVADLKVNNQLVAELGKNYPNPITFNVVQGDLVTIEIVTDPLEPIIDDGLTVSVQFGPVTLLTWYSNYYFSPMVAPSVGCSNPPPPPPPNPTGSPFGGLLYPITQEQIKEFLARTGTSYSTLWYRETVPDNFADGRNNILV